MKLTVSQIMALSEIARDIGQVFFATMVVSPFLIGIDKINWLVIIGGGILSFVFWTLSVFLAKRDKK